MDRNAMNQSEIETDARPGPSESERKSSGSTNEPTRTIEYIHKGGGRTTLHLGPNASEKLPNIQIGDQNFMMVGDTGACSSRRKSKNNKKPKKNIEAPDRPITDAECDTISENLGRDYKKFSRRMGFKEVQIEQIEMDYRDEGHYEITYQLLRKLRNLGKDKLQDVVDTLQIIERDDILEELNII